MGRLSTAAAVVGTAPLWAVVDRAEAGGYLRRDAARWADCLDRPDLAALPPRALFARLVAAHPE